MTADNQVSPEQLVKLYRRAVEQGLPLDKLDKKISHRVERARVSRSIDQEEEKRRVSRIKQHLPKAVRYGALTIPVLFIGVGLYLLGSAVLPIAQYYTNTLPQLTKHTLKAPIPYEQVLDVTPFVVARTVDSTILGSETRTTGPVILDTELDYTNLNNWFADDRSNLLTDTSATDEYTLEIPKIDISNAKVRIGGTDLNKNLIAYPGTALPGKPGAPVIFGHSVLRQFYNPSEKNPRRYNSIFSYIMTLEPNDEIFVTHQGVRYRYVVRDKTEVKPEDTYILGQQYDQKLLKLVTCVPEGTYLRRGVVTAELVPS